MAAPHCHSYALCIERMDVHVWIAHVSGLPGCFTDTRHPTPQPAIAAAPQAIADWHAWANRGAEPEPGAPLPSASEIRVSVAEQHDCWFHGVQPRAGYEVHAFFAADRPALTQDEVALASDLLARAEADLRSAVAGLDTAALDYRHPGEWSIGDTLQHVGWAEWYYLDCIGRAFPEADLPTAPHARLQTARAHLVATLPSLIGDTSFTTPNAEVWTPRKVLRRTLWHARDHTSHIRRLRTLLPPHLHGE